MSIAPLLFEASSRAWRKRVARITVLGGLVLLGACGSLEKRADTVAITASQDEVRNCEQIGPVELVMVHDEFDLRQRDLRAETVLRGGNVLLTDSFTGSTSGTAYLCYESLDPSRPAS